MNLLAQLQAASRPAKERTYPVPTDATCRACAAELSTVPILAREIQRRTGMSMTQIRGALVVLVEQGVAMRGEALRWRGAYEYVKGGAK